MLAVATMTRAVKAVTTYRGRDPRDFTLCAFGGNGPLTGVEIARSLAMSSVLDPALSRRLQRPRAALLRHRARGRAHADAARRRDHRVGPRGGVRRDRGRDDGVSRRHGRRHRDREPLRGRALRGPGLRALGRRAAGPGRRRAPRRRLRRRARAHLRPRLGRRSRRRRLDPRARPHRAHRGAAVRPGRGDPRAARRTRARGSPTSARTSG